MTDLLDFVSLRCCRRGAGAWLPTGCGKATRPPSCRAGWSRRAPTARPSDSVDVQSIAADAIRRARGGSIAAIPWSAPAYPIALTTIADPPPVLWTRGRLDVLSAPAVAIVGSRAASPYGLAVASQLAADLAARGLVIVSGLARGVDSAAHRGALSAGGATVAVLGSGVDVVYPPEHASLAGDIDAGRRRDQRTGARHPSATVVLPAAQPDHQRTVARCRRHRGEREERVADHRAMRARPGPRRPRGSRQRPDRPEPRRPRAPARRGKDRGVRGRYPGRARSGESAGRGRAARPVRGGGRRRARLSTRSSALWCRARPPISTRLPNVRASRRRVCCPACSSWNCGVWCGASAGGGSFGLTERVRVKRDYGKDPCDRGIADEGADARAISRRSI